MQINTNKIKVNVFTAEIDGELDRDARTILLTEVEIYEVATRDNQDGTFDQVYKAKVVGATDIKQGEKLVKGKSKRSWSQKLRQAVWKLGADYDGFMAFLFTRLESLIDEYQKSKL